MRRTLPVDWRFADWLRLELNERGWGVRTLARKIAANEDGDIDIIRRQLTRHIGAHSWPSEPYRIAIGRAFDVPADDLPTRNFQEEKV